MNANEYLPDLEATTLEGHPREDWSALIEDGAELQTRELPPMVQIVEGIVGEFSKLSIVSSAKCFKTWLTIYLALCVSHGIEFLGRATSRRRVLYVNLELKPVPGELLLTHRWTWPMHEKQGVTARPQVAAN